MLNTNREFYAIFQNRAGDKIKPQMRESPAQIGRVGMSDFAMCYSRKDPYPCTEEIENNILFRQPTDI